VSDGNWLARQYERTGAEVARWPAYMREMLDEERGRKAMTEPKPAVVYPPGTYVLEEMAERGWTFERLCAECRWKGEVPWAHWLRLYICGDRDVDECMTYSVSRGLARAFGTSVDVWVGLDIAWQTILRASAKW